MLLSVPAVGAVVLPTSLVLRRCRTREADERPLRIAVGLYASASAAGRLLSPEDVREVLVVADERWLEGLREWRLDSVFDEGNDEDVGWRDRRRSRAEAAAAGTSDEAESLAGTRPTVRLRRSVGTEGALTSIIELFSAASRPDGDETGWSKMLRLSMLFSTGTRSRSSVCDAGRADSGACDSPDAHA